MKLAEAIEKMRQDEYPDTVIYAEVPFTAESKCVIKPTSYGHKAEKERKRRFGSGYYLKISDDNGYFKVDTDELIQITESLRSKRPFEEEAK